MSTEYGEWGEIERAAALAGPAPEDDGPPQLYYESALQFVSQLLAPTYRRNLGAPGLTWCPEWWRDAEAIARLDALWRAWEHLRLDGTPGLSQWYRDHADHHRQQLSLAASTLSWALITDAPNERSGIRRLSYTDCRTVRSSRVAA